MGCDNGIMNPVKMPKSTTIGEPRIMQPEGNFKFEYVTYEKTMSWTAWECDKCGLTLFYRDKDE